MADQWYLDLDGTRSGPYPTNEVLSLIEEGEVLPHHRISRGLRNPDWITILDWRFEQAKATLKPAPAPTTPPSSPSSNAASSNAAKLKLNLTANPAGKKTATPVPTFSTTQPEFQKTAQPVVSAPSAEATPPRDPMAEMFDLLQNTKHKREAKQAQQAQQSQPLSSASSTPDRGSIGKLIAICVGVAILGLVLGQMLQGKSKSPPSASSPSPKSAGETEVIDRSNDKMTIKTVVEKKPEPSTYQPPAPARTPYIAPTPFRREEPAAAERKQTEKELEELRDLKKELEELKSLKEQLKESSIGEEFTPPEGSAVPQEGDASTGAAPGAGATPESRF
jgi:hypothetical protein